MSQNDWGTMNPATEDGVALANHLNGHRDALMTSHSGAARPAYAKAGTVWLKTPATGNWQLMLFNGSADIPLFSFSGVTPVLNPLTVALPAGIIMLWNSGTGVPSGWGVANGSTYSRVDGSGNIVSPDLRGRFIVGVSGQHPFGEIGGSSDTASFQTLAGGGHTHTLAVGGAHDHGGSTGATTLTINQIPAHRHGIPGSARANYPEGSTISYDYHYSSDTANEVNERSNLAGGGLAHSHAIGQSVTHTHTVGAADDHTHTVSIRWPAYTALIYIMKL
jgi:hypothetical protein